MRLICIFIAVLCFIAPAHAQNAQNSEQTQRLMQFAANNDVFDKRVSDQAKIVFARQFPGCASVDQVVRQLPQAYGDITFPPGTLDERFPAPISGLWVERVKIRACNKVRQINMLAAGQMNGAIVLLALLPGDTRADPAIQRDAERIGATSITKADATCSDAPIIQNTHVIGFRDAQDALAATDTGQGWFEEWDYRFCQKDVSAQIAFTPNKDGAFDVKARPVGAATPQAPASKPVIMAPADQTPPAPATPKTP